VQSHPRHLYFKNGRYGPFEHGKVFRLYITPVSAAGCYTAYGHAFGLYEPAHGKRKDNF
jgi:hypothetical protein